MLMKRLNKAWEKLVSRMNGIRMTAKFLIVYVLLGVIPLVAFTGWYFYHFVQEQHKVQTYEKQIILGQSGELLENQLQHSELIHGILQSNTALVSLLDGTYRSASDELFAYDRQIKPVFTSILASEPIVDDIFIYRYAGSALTQSELVYYLLGIDEFAYNPALLDDLKTVNTVRYLSLGPTQNASENSSSFSPKMIYLMNLYNQNYSKVLGILEVRIDLNKALQHMDFPHEDETLYLKWQNQYYPVLSESSKIQLGQGIPGDQVFSRRGTSPLASPLRDWDMELVYFYRFDSSILTSTLYSVVITVLFLLFPSFLFWLYINHFASSLQRFSRHIRSNRKTELVPYEIEPDGDEFGVVVSEYNRLIRKVQALIESVKQAEKLKRDASYYAMASQINPHFMFNTLENIRMHIEVEDAEGASNMLFILSRFLRYNISMRQDSTLFDELEHIRNYLKIYQYRQQKKIEFQVEISPSVRNIACPFCILQPIVENCVKHGLLPRSCLEIQITVSQNEDATLVEIADNGAGIPEEKLAGLNAALAGQPGDAIPAQADEDGSVGLSNVNGRLKYFYGPTCGLAFRSREPHGVACVLTFGGPSRDEPPQQPERS